MSTVLAIAGCGPRLEIAVTASGLSAPGLVAISGPTPRSDLIVAAIDVLLRACVVGAETIDAVVATTGPGSFTGIRVALATALGFASARGIVTHGFSSLAAQAARTAVRPCLAVQPARRGHVWAQAFGVPPGAPSAIEPPVVVATADLAGASFPVIAPVGLELPSGLALAPAAASTAEALILLTSATERLDPATLAPSYHEAPLTEAKASTPPWLRSHRAS